MFWLGRNMDVASLTSAIALFWILGMSWLLAVPCEVTPANTQMEQEVQLSVLIKEKCQTLHSGKTVISIFHCFQKVFGLKINPLIGKYIQQINIDNQNND